ncbi:MAG: hypothetical protein EZS28_017858, partial [Streblomastix strix]
SQNIFRHNQRKQDTPSLWSEKEQDNLKIEAEKERKRIESEQQQRLKFEEEQNRLRSEEEERRRILAEQELIRQQQEQQEQKELLKKEDEIKEIIVPTQVKVKFVLYGLQASNEKRIVVLGNQPQLGNWNSGQAESSQLALKLESHYKSETIELPPNETIEYKFVQLEDQPIWESGNNRKLIVEDYFLGKGTIYLISHWNDIRELNITESALENNSGETWEFVEDD